MGSIWPGGTILICLLIVCTACTSDSSRGTAVDGPSPSSQVTPTPQASASASDQLPGKRVDVSEIAEQVARVRGLPILTDIEARELSGRQWNRLARKYIAPRSRDPQTLLLESLGLIPKGVSLLEATRRYLTTAMGIYDSRDDVLYLNGNYRRPAALRALTIAHEVTHALQDQSFDLTSLVAESRDEALAHRSLVEGDALITEERWSSEYQSERERRLLRAILSGRAGHGFDPLRTILFFPYEQGADFVKELEEQGGPDAVDEAFDDPPVSTEQILHIDEYLGENEVVFVPPFRRPGPDWQTLVESDFGELDLRMMLQPMGKRSASELASGWATGRLKIWRRGRNVAVGLLAKFDAPAHLQAFCKGLPSWIRAATRARRVIRNVYTDGSVWMSFKCVHDVGNLGLARIGISTDPKTAERIS
jgi:hypothetical protein